MPLGPALFLLLSLSLAVARECRSGHEFYEESKERRTKETMGECGAISGWCIKVIYKDSDPRKKQGFSRGCDQSDCVGVGESAWGWDENGCKAHTDYGDEGKICCCNSHDYCNSAPVAVPFATLAGLMTLFLLILKL